jgi:conjugative transposon TraM protein
MQMKPHSQMFLQKRKFIMALPLLVLPFLTMIFWALGGGEGSPAQAKSNEKTGLNLELPDAHFNTEEWNKLSLYEKAERDSLKFEEEGKNDPYFTLATLKEQTSKEEQGVRSKQTSIGTSNSIQGTSTKKRVEYVDPNEEKVNQKLDQLYRELNKTSTTPGELKREQTVTEDIADPQFSSDVDKLEQMMEMMNKGDQNDPEMQQIGGMLDKILDIQHPERVREKIKEESEQKKGQVFPVNAVQSDDNIALMTPIGIQSSIVADSTALLSRVFSVKVQQNSFYGLEDDASQDSEVSNAIEAVIHDTQELVAGSTVKMRLLSDVYINGKLISKDQFVYGTCSINAERLTIEVNSVRNGKSLFPVSLSVYDLDGLEGIYIPGAITRDAAKQSSDQAMQSMQFLTMNQSLEAQAASAGLQAAKGLFSKKVKQIKVTVKAGYNLLLKDKQ